MFRRAKPLLTGTAMLALALTAACSDSGTIDNADGSATDAPPPLTAYDPPLGFDTDTVATLGEGIASTSDDDDEPDSAPVALHGVKAIIAEWDRVTVVDLVTGEQSPPVQPPGAAEGGAVERETEPPRLVEWEGATLALVPFLLNKPAAGTAAPGVLLELVALDVDTEEIAWTAEVEMDSFDPDRQLWATIAGADEDRAIVGINSTLDPWETVAVDVATGETLWRAPLEPHFYQEGKVIGCYTDTYSRLSAVSGETGVVEWNATEVACDLSFPAAPGFVAMNREEVLDENDEVAVEASFELLDFATGATVASLPELQAENCLLDGETALVCSGNTWESGHGVWGFDPATLEELWSLPTDERVEPTITAVWHGAVYGYTDNGPVVLSSVDGTDIATDPGFAPDVVNEYFGVGFYDSTEVLSVAASA